MPSTYVSYRPEDTGWLATRLHAALVSEFGPHQVFMDAPTTMDMPNAREEVKKTVLRADALVVLIGQNWIDGDTIDFTSDSDRFLRTAIRARLYNINSAADLRRVLAVLVNREEPPTLRSLAPLSLQRLSLVQRLRLRDWEWDFDVVELVHSLKQLDPPKPASGFRDIFISYVEEDGAVASSLAEALRVEGYSTWMYEVDGVPGVSYLTQVNGAIEHCRAVVLVASRRTVKAHQVIREIEAAHELARMIIPVRVGLTHEEFMRSSPILRMAIGTAVTLPLDQKNVAGTATRIANAMRAASEQSGT